MTAAPRIGVVTCAVLPEPDPDQEPLLTALRAAGLEPRLVAWDDDAARVDDLDLAVLRSCWNYHERSDDFLAWLERTAAACPVVNPLRVLRWNLHKRYLLELESAGLPIVPTALVERGAEASLAALTAARGWADVVVKPAVSAASANTRRFRDPTTPAATAFLATLAARGDVLVQPWMASVEGEGEHALVWIDGEGTHAIRKSVRLAAEDESVSDGRPPTDEEHAFVAATLAAAPFAAEGLTADDLLYARIDVMRDADGALRLSELELLEPSLFLVQHEPALQRLVAAIRRRAEAGR